MGFGTDLQGRTSHDALLRIQDTEIKLLETMKSCLQKKIDGDKKYAQSLFSFVQLAQKFEKSEYSTYCSLFQAWETIVCETEKLAQLFQRKVDQLVISTLEKLSTLISEKRSARKRFEDERNRLEKEFSRVKDDVHNCKQEYTKSLERVRTSKVKFEEISTKGKSGSRLDDAKQKYQRDTMKLHKSHNDYVVALRQVQTHQENYLNSTLPQFLNFHQVYQEVLVEQCKNFLDEYQSLTSFATKDHNDIFKAIEAAVNKIDHTKEYTGEFLSSNKSDQLIPITFEFDSKLLDDYQGNLKAKEIAIDEFTVETLTSSKSRLEEEIKKLESTLENKESTRKEHETRINEIQRQKLTSDNPEYMECLNKRKVVIDLKREVVELKSNLKTSKEVLKLIDEPLQRFDGKTPPPAMDDMPLICEIQGSEGQNVGKTLNNLFSKIKFSRKKADSNTPDGKEEEEEKQITNYEPNVSSANGNLGVKPKSPVTRSSKLEDQQWFHGVLPRDEVQRLLVKDGDFLVRQSTNKKTNEVQYVLSVFWQGHRHFIIQYQEGGGWRFEGQAYSTIPELVMQQYQSKSPITNKSQAYLYNPILRESWELNNDDVALETKIGTGCFGEVFRGLYKPTGQVVAVKTCKDTLSEEQRKKFLMEGRILKQYDHANIVKFIGIATQRQPVMILMEYVAGGALLNFLRKEGRRQSKVTLTKMCCDAACGMAYLEERGCIHRDLAARNCLVGDNSIVKISDFGMSREEEEYTVSDGLKQIPIKWTAPEALNFGKYTSMCDVWSYGILMWEVFSFGQTPYPGWTNGQARESVEQGYRMPPPVGVPDPVFALTLRCWEREPSNRPHFDVLYKELKALLDQPSITNSWN
ncbi:hypothetical protein ACJMK2_025448 [Sinanodonta woodiana]|uniref:Tyrosine-protein kinase n=1 Tax=Sinanodonta woodiana TaxID=1069815 RepID=A0ABD3XIX2_SINWO